MFSPHWTHPQHLQILKTALFVLAHAREVKTVLIVHNNFESGFWTGCFVNGKYRRPICNTIPEGEQVRDNLGAWMILCGFLRRRNYQDNIWAQANQCFDHDAMNLASTGRLAHKTTHWSPSNLVFVYIKLGALSKLQAPSLMAGFRSSSGEAAKRAALEMTCRQSTPATEEVWRQRNRFLVKLPFFYFIFHMLL